VLDYVLVHELAHLLVPGHGAEFWKWVRRYPKTERAVGYLEGLSAAAHLNLDMDDDTDDDTDDDGGA
jgi:predicted metal-dependent hydrolase